MSAWKPQPEYARSINVSAIRRSPGVWVFRVRDYLGAHLGKRQARTKYLAMQAGNDLKRQLLKQYPKMT